MLSGCTVQTTVDSAANDKVPVDYYGIITLSLSSESFELTVGGVAALVKQHLSDQSRDLLCVTESIFQVL